MLRYVFKVLLLGNSAVGKTSLLYRFIENKFSATYNFTMGVDFLSKEVLVSPDEAAKLTVWDVAGQKKFQFMRETIYKGTNGALLVFDLTRGDTYRDIEAWLSELREIVDNNIPFILIGNKADLIEDVGRSVDKNAAKEVATNNKSIYIETSAKTGEKVEDAFFELTRLMIQKRKTPDIPPLEEIPMNEDSFVDEIQLIEIEERPPSNPYEAEGLLIKAFYEKCGKDALPLIRNICGRQGKGIGQEASQYCYDNRLSAVAEDFAQMLSLETKVIYSSDDKFQIQCFKCPFGLENTSRELCEAVMEIDKEYFNAILFKDIDVIISKSLASGHESCDIIYQIREPQLRSNKNNG